MRMCGIVLAMCLTACGGLPNPEVMAPVQGELDRLAMLYCNSNPFVLAGPAVDSCRSLNIHFTQVPG